MNRRAISAAELQNPREVWNARDYGLVGDGVANDQPAFAALVDELGRACKADARPRAIYCPPGVYRIANETSARYLSQITAYDKAIFEECAALESALEHLLARLQVYR